MINILKSRLNEFVHSLGNYDYMLFGAIVIIFIFLLVLAILFRKKPAFSIFLVLFSFIFLLVSPYFAYFKMHEIIYANELTLTYQQRLQYTEAIVVYGKLKNISDKNFKECTITAKVTKASKNKYKNILYSFKTIKKMSIVKKDIKKDKQIGFKMLIEPFRYKKRYNLKLKAICR